MTMMRKFLGRGSSTAILAAPAAALIGLMLASGLATAASAPTQFNLGPFQNFFETARPYIMVGFLAVGMWVLLHNFARTLTGTLKSQSAGAATLEHRASLGHLFELVVLVVVLEGVVYVTLWHGLDLFSSLINLFQQAFTTSAAP